MHADTLPVSFEASRLLTDLFLPLRTDVCSQLYGLNQDWIASFDFWLLLRLEESSLEKGDILRDWVAFVSSLFLRPSFERSKASLLLDVKLTLSSSTRLRALAESFCLRVFWLFSGLLRPFSLREILFDSRLLFALFSILINSSPSLCFNCCNFSGMFIEASTRISSNRSSSSTLL